MKKIWNYLPAHFCVFLVVGICIQYYFNFWYFGFAYLFVLLAIFIILFLIVDNKFIRTISVLILFFFLGVSSVYFQKDSNYKNYFKNHLQNNSTIILKIEKVLKPGTFNKKYEAKVYQIDSVKTRGRVLLNIKNDSLSLSFNINDLVMLNTDIQKLKPPLNPYQFDYTSYLDKRGIHYQIFTKNDNIRILNFKTSSLRSLAHDFRNKIQNLLKKYNFKKDEYGVINALLLGQRNEVSKELITDYSRAGAIHILAISGLHVGIILFLLLKILKPLDFLKNGKVYKIIITVILLWAFTLITGFSASVVRSVTMFSFLSFGLLLNRNNITEFSIISSFLFLLIVQPMFLFDVGFQLSYLAVFSIVWLHPKINRLWSPKYKLIRFFWQLLTVSVAAQIGILPLSIYYFNQFPGLFLLSNLIIIPFLGTILLLGILIIFFSLLNILPDIFAQIYGDIISTMNKFITWISHQEYFLFQDITISQIKMLLIYLLILSLISVLMRCSYKKIVFFLTVIIFLQANTILENFNNNRSNEFVLFHKSKNSIHIVRIGENLNVYHNLEKSKVEEFSFFKSYKHYNIIKKTNHLKCKNAFQYKGQNFLFVDSLAVYDIGKFKKSSVILQYSPKLNLERLISKLEPKIIIADGSNYKSYVTIWEKISKKHDIPFYYTGEKGAFILKNKSF